MAWNERSARRALVERILRRMRILDMTQQDLAAKIGSARSSVSVMLDVEGTAWFAGEKMVRLPEALRCSADWLFMGRGAETGADASPREQQQEGYRMALDDMGQDLAARRQAFTRPLRPHS